MGATYNKNRLHILLKKLCNSHISSHRIVIGAVNVHRAKEMDKNATKNFVTTTIEESGRDRVGESENDWEKREE